MCLKQTFGLWVKLLSLPVSFYMFLHFSIQTANRNNQDWLWLVNVCLIWISIQSAVFNDKTLVTERAECFYWFAWTKSTPCGHFCPVSYRVASKSIWTPQAYLKDIVHPKTKIWSFTQTIFFSGTYLCPMKVNGFQTKLDKIWTKRLKYSFCST